MTVIEIRGHAPRDAGAKMVVAADAQLGQHRRRQPGADGGGPGSGAAGPRAPRRPEMLESELNEHVRNAHGQQCCGGVVRLLLEPLPAWPTVAIFGVGHVGYELARILSRLELRLHLVDSRAEELDPLRLADVTSGVAEVSIHRAVLGELVLERLPRGSHVLIMTHDHAEDFALCDAAIRDPGLASIGLIGSRAKRARFAARLAQAGHAPAAIERIQCPIGLPDITGKEPAVIAIGAAAALAEVFRARPDVGDRPPRSRRPEPVHDALPGPGAGRAR